jgi:Uma2 family endonuclease
MWNFGPPAVMVIREMVAMQNLLVFDPTEERWAQDKPAPSLEEVYYPESDGKPLGETDWHITAIFYLRQALRLFFRTVENVYVAANNLFYYEEGNPRVFVVPDVYVVKGVSKQNRRIYKLWEEQVAPSVVFEITLRSTRREDLGDKRALYEMLGVQEYFLFDPEGDYLKPQLQGFRLLAEFYTPIPHEQDGSVYSQELGLWLRPEGELLRLLDPATGQILPTLDEAVEEMAEALTQADEARRYAQTEAERAQAEAERADAAERELARLRAELERLQRKANQE